MACNIVDLHLIRNLDIDVFYLDFEVELSNDNQIVFDEQVFVVVCYLRK